MTTIVAPISVGDRTRKAKWQITLPLLLILVVVAAVAIRLKWPSKPVANVGTYYTVIPGDLDVKIIKDGELQAANNIDIICLVEGQTTIQHIVKEGSYVTKGQ